MNLQVASFLFENYLQKNYSPRNCSVMLNVKQKYKNYSFIGIYYFVALELISMNMHLAVTGLLLINITGYYDF